MPEGSEQTESILFLFLVSEELFAVHYIWQLYLDGKQSFVWSRLMTIVYHIKWLGVWVYYPYYIGNENYRKDFYGPYCIEKSGFSNSIINLNNNIYNNITLKENNSRPKNTGTLARWSRFFISRKSLEISRPVHPYYKL